MELNDNTHQPIPDVPNAEYSAANQYAVYFNFIRSNAMIFIVAIAITVYIWNKWRTNAKREDAMNNIGLYENNNSKLLQEHDKMLFFRSKQQEAYSVLSAEHNEVQAKKDIEKRKEKLKEKGKTKSQKLNYASNLPASAGYFPLSGSGGANYKPIKKSPSSGG